MKTLIVLALVTTSCQVFASDVWGELRSKSLLTNQSSVTGRDDLCAAAAAVNLAQGLAKQLSVAPFENPHEVFEETVKKYPGKNDDIGLYQMAQVLQTVLKRAFPTEKLKVESLLLDRYTEKNMQGIQPVEKLTKSDLTPALNEKKILNIDLFDGNGKYKGGHAVVVDSVVGDELKFINSFEPNADSRARMYLNPGSMWKGNQIPTFKILSPVPAGPNSPHAFFVRGVITVKKL